MATYADNDIYLDIDGTAVSAYFKKVLIDPTVEEQDTTAGSGKDHRERVGGLKDTKISITVMYDTAVISTQLSLFAPGLHTVTYGPQGSTAGLPKHVQLFLFTGAPFEVSVEKSPVMFDVSGVGAAAPSVDMRAGGVWS